MKKYNYTTKSLNLNRDNKEDLRILEYLNTKRKVSDYLRELVLKDMKQEPPIIEENHEEATIKNRHSWAKALNLWDNKRQLAKYKAYSFFQTYQIWRKENQNDITWK